MYQQQFEQTIILHPLNRFMLLLAFVCLLGGCAAAVITGAAAGTIVVMDNRTAGDLVEDQNIEIKFMKLYMQDKQLQADTHINAVSYNRRLLLSGEATNETLRQQVEQLAKRIKNIRFIYNEVIIAEPATLKSRANDVYLSSRIKTALIADQQTEGLRVKIYTENATVYLMGLVTESQGHKISELVRQIPGVARVVKLFEYQSPNDKRI